MYDYDYDDYGMNNITNAFAFFVMCPILIFIWDLCHYTYQKKDIEHDSACEENYSTPLEEVDSDTTSTVSGNIDAPNNGVLENTQDNGILSNRIEEEQASARNGENLTTCRGELPTSSENSEEDPRPSSVAQVRSTTSEQAEAPPTNGTSSQERSTSSEDQQEAPEEDTLTSQISQEPPIHSTYTPRRPAFAEGVSVGSSSPQEPASSRRSRRASLICQREPAPSAEAQIESVQEGTSRLAISLIEESLPSNRLERQPTRYTAYTPRREPVYFYDERRDSGHGTGTCSPQDPRLFERLRNSNRSRRNSENNTSSREELTSPGPSAAHSNGKEFIPISRSSSDNEGEAIRKEYEEVKQEIAQETCLRRAAMLISNIFEDNMKSLADRCKNWESYKEKNDITEAGIKLIDEVLQEYSNLKSLEEVKVLRYLLKRCLEGESKVAPTPELLHDTWWQITQKIISIRINLEALDAQELKLRAKQKNIRKISADSSLLRETQSWSEKKKVKSPTTEEEQGRSRITRNAGQQHSIPGPSTSNRSREETNGSREDRTRSREDRNRSREDRTRSREGRNRSREDKNKSGGEKNRSRDENKKRK